MELRKLSIEFYRQYNRALYPNILYKDDRSYTILKLETPDNTFGIPVKTNIKHNASFLFKESGRKSVGDKPGLDFKNSVVLYDDAFINDKDAAIIDRLESIYLYKNEDKIRNEFQKYIKGYIAYVNDPIAKLHESPRYIYTSLEYFWTELGIKTPNDIDRKELIRNSYIIYLIIDHLQKDFNISKGCILKRKINDNTVSLSYNGRYIIKELIISEVSQYIEIKSSYNEKGEIRHQHIETDRYKELHNKLKSIIEEVSASLVESK